MSTGDFFWLKFSLRQKKCVSEGEMINTEREGAQDIYRKLMCMDTHLHMFHFIKPQRSRPRRRTVQAARREMWGALAVDGGRLLISQCWYVSLLSHPINIIIQKLSWQAGDEGSDTQLSSVISTSAFLGGIGNIQGGTSCSEREKKRERERLLKRDNFGICKVNILVIRFIFHMVCKNVEETNNENISILCYFIL